MLGPNESDHVLDPHGIGWRSRERLVVGGAIVAGVLMLVCVGTVAWSLLRGSVGDTDVRPAASPSEEKEGTVWTLDELFDHLKAKRVVERRTDGSRGETGGPIQVFYTRDSRRVRVMQCSSPAAAKPYARDIGRRGSSHVFAWGRFIIDTSGEWDLVDQIQAALRQPPD
jgi:hypothetical protein